MLKHVGSPPLVPSPFILWPSSHLSQDKQIPKTDSVKFCTSISSVGMYLLASVHSERYLSERPCAYIDHSLGPFFKVFQTDNGTTTEVQSGRHRRTWIKTSANLFSPFRRCRYRSPWCRFWIWMYSVCVEAIYYITLAVGTAQLSVWNSL